MDRFFRWTKSRKIAYSFNISYPQVIHMEKQKKWHWALILTVFALTLYNIIPTIIYYAKPLKNSVSEEVGKKTAADIGQRIRAMEGDSVEWLNSYCTLLNIKPLSISIDTSEPQQVLIYCAKAEDAALLQRALLRAGSLIPFVPSQLPPLAAESHSKTVTVFRRIPVAFNDEAIERYFSYTTRFEKDGSISPLYAETVLDRAAQIASLAAGLSDASEMIKATRSYTVNEVPEELLLGVASKINSTSDLFKNSEALRVRFCSNMTSGNTEERSASLDHLSASMDALRDRLRLEKSTLQKQTEEEALTSNGAETVRLIEKKEGSLSLAQLFLKKQRSSFLNGPASISFDVAYDSLKKTLPTNSTTTQTISLSASPFFSDLTIDWNHGELSLKLRSDLASLRNATTGEANRDQLEQLLIKELARIASSSKETFAPDKDTFSLRLHQLTEASSFLVFDLIALAKDQSAGLLKLLQKEWHPKHPDLLPEHFPIVDAAGYSALSERQKKLCLCVFSQASESPLSKDAINHGSLYIFARGLDRILQQSQSAPSSSASKTLQSDFASLSSLLRQGGFSGYSAAAISPEHAGDYLFERPDAARPILAATREEFQAKGALRYALLEFSDLEQRIITQNRIDTRVHEDLLKWRDEYLSSQAMPEASMRYDVPRPTKSVFWSNIALSFKKYFRGDDRKIIRWGLDLSGGKTVQIELRDQNNKLVSSETDIRQGINELFNRVNKMGVSEVAIRQLGNNIVLDFPGSQALGASELVKASSMYFHIVNEKFYSANPQLAELSSRFLQEVWNEAVVMHRQDPDSINAIAWKHLHGDSVDPNSVRPRSDAARTLYEQGLRLQPPTDRSCSSSLDDSVTKIALIRSESDEPQKQGHPLLFVFANYALEGSNLTNVRSSYDPAKGNFLSFDVKGSATARDGQHTNPQSELHAWTSQFSEEQITGTPKEHYSRGSGWRMAVVLNNSVISAPTLNSALKDSAMISGSFTQREVSQLASDLKAGSLTFTPHILSEKNVSPELGKSDRMKGIIATVAALVLVILSMICYYRFAGLVASVAVLINLLILWATLQNLQATLSLAGIAGIILTVGMAVDANVLVFERIKEELASGKRLAAAIAAGYQKAFSAILDSNVTTIIAALILLNFDAGPIKGFAITLIIGIASSMFTALFMTRAYFTRWLGSTTSKTLHMANWVRSSSINFLKWSKGAIALSVAIIAIGGTLFTMNHTTLFGMDFTGGYALEFEVASHADASTAVSEALQNSGASAQDFQIRQLNPSTHLRVLFSTAMEQSGKPFHSSSASAGVHSPQIEWVLSSLGQHGISLTQESLASIDTNWIAISGQMSDSMRNNALIGLGIAFACIFIYLTIRFESSFAASAIICLLHDVCITLGIVGLLHAFKVPVQIDLNTIAALMTIIGYSLNDTIIIFDRIREDVKEMKGQSLKEIVNHSLNATLSRTSITSGTTLIALIALVLLGGSSIFSFALVMTIGVVFGTLSSWFIAAPLLLAFHRKQSKESAAVTIV
jgi:SecD/SecF fusion protein